MVHWISGLLIEGEEASFKGVSFFQLLTLRYNIDQFVKSKVRSSVQRKHTASYSLHLERGRLSTGNMLRFYISTKQMR